MKILSTNIIEISVYQIDIDWRHKIIPNESIKNASNVVVDILLYKNY